MSRNRSGFVLGYHGCAETVADAVLAGAPMRISTRDYDWLGSGAYFWESDADRAAEWAVARGYTKPAVIGAVIDLGNCLDLTLRADLGLLADAYQSLKSGFAKAGKPLPENRDLPRGGGSAPKPLRYLDCAVINHLHDNIEEDARAMRAAGSIPVFEPFDTVRGLFLEGEHVYDGGGFYTHTHTQIVVRAPDSIRGVFRPR